MQIIYYKISFPLYYIFSNKQHHISNYYYLKDKGRKKVLEEYEKKLKSVITHKELNREVSYQYLIRLECYKIIKHILGDKKYEGFKMWW